MKRIMPSTFLRFLAMKDDWFTNDLKKMDDDNVYRKIQAHPIVEFPEMVAILNAKIWKIPSPL